MEGKQGICWQRKRKIKYDNLWREFVVGGSVQGLGTWEDSRQ